MHAHYEYHYALVYANLLVALLTSALDALILALHYLWLDTTRQDYRIGSLTKRSYVDKNQQENGISISNVYRYYCSGSCRVGLVGCRNHREVTSALTLIEVQVTYANKTRCATLSKEMDTAAFN